MIPFLLILIPLLSGLVCFIIRDEKTARYWSLFASIAALAVSLAGITIMNSNKDLEFHAEWMQVIGSSFSVKLDGMGQLLCLLTAVAYPIIFIGTWNSTYKNAPNFFALMLLAQAGLMGVFVAMDAFL